MIFVTQHILSASNITKDHEIREVKTIVSSEPTRFYTTQTKENETKRESETAMSYIEIHQTSAN